MDDERCSVNRSAGAGGPRLIVAIPANDEAERIETCLAALAGQRDFVGTPVAGACFEILLFANNCSDATAAAATAFAAGMPQEVIVIDEALPEGRSNAGWARKRAMDLAAARLTERGRFDGILLTTDADSCVAPTWIAATLRAFDEGAEDAYLRAIAEIHARCDPRPHDPWPNHRVSSGASLAVTLTAYLAIGGLPPVPVGEDAALTHALECAGFKVRHTMDAAVTTSCRLDGRAKGGAAETMNHRLLVPDSPCDEDIEPALHAARRALHRGRLRRLDDGARLARCEWAGRLGVPAAEAAALVRLREQDGFEAFWQELSRASPVLRERVALRPSDLPRQIARAGMLLARLRRPASVPGPTTAPGDRFPLPELFEPEAA